MDTSTRALQEAISIRRQIDALENRLSSILGASSPSSSARGGRRRMSAATRAKLAAAARARWAKQKAGRKTTTTEHKKKGGITPAGRKRISQLKKACLEARRKEAGKK